MQKPKVTVILPVFNGEQYLKESILSILKQSYFEFDFLIINDCSTDQSEKIIKSFSDKRIKYLCNDHNLGLAATLNKAIALSKGDFIVRQDQDDISLPERLSYQIEYLKHNKNVALVGSWAQILRNDFNTGKFLKHPADNHQLKFALLFNNPFVHSSVVIRRKVITEMKGYSQNPNWQPPEDYELWSRIAYKYDLGNIPKVLLKYREIETSMSRNKNQDFDNIVKNISKRNIVNLTKKTWNIVDLDNLHYFMNKQFENIKEPIDINEILTALMGIKGFISQDNPTLDGYIYQIWAKNRQEWLNYQKPVNRVKRSLCKIIR